MNKATSVLLDVLRIIAAYGVFIGHCGLPWYALKLAGVQSIARFSHQFVIVFFVLSGYVIASSTLNRARDARRYALARMARLYSVVAPGVLLTEILWTLGGKVNPAFYATFDRGHEFLRSILAVFFLNELWFISACPASNGPLWSLGYEFWYYILFAAVVFPISIKRKIFFSVLVSLMAGPKILLLAPVWVLGAAIYPIGKQARLSDASAIGGLLASLACAATLLLIGWQFPQPVGTAGLWYSSAFVSDILLGIAVCSFIFFFDQLFRDIRVPRLLESPVRRIANMTFSLYVYHFPLLVFAAAIFDVKRLPLFSAMAVTFGVLLVVILLSAVTEQRKQNVRSAMELVLDWGHSRSSRLAAS